MHKEIGSKFWLDAKKIYNLEKNINFNEIKQLEYEDITYLWTGRSAIGFTLDNIECSCKKALLPAYTCHTVIDPFIDKGYEVGYYNINESLEINIEDFKNKVETFRPSIVLFHSYYGFDTLDNMHQIVKNLKENKIIIIEDLTQSLFSNINHLDADYYIGSFRKWLAIPDGGFAISCQNKFNNKPVEINNKLVKTNLKAFNSKNLYMEENIGEKIDFLKLYSKAENIIDESKSIYNISKESRYILSKMDKSKLVEKRRENFEFLLKNINNTSLISKVFNKIDSNITPLYFPIYIKGDRTNLQKYLAESSIYLPIIWPMTIHVKDELDEKTTNVYNEILAIPCDQRYGIDEMRKIVELLNEYSEVK